MIGSTNDGNFYGGTGVDFMYGQATDGGDVLYRKDGTRFQDADGGLTAQAGDDGPQPVGRLRQEHRQGLVRPGLQRRRRHHRRLRHRARPAAEPPRRHPAHQQQRQRLLRRPGPPRLRRRRRRGQPHLGLGAEPLDAEFHPADRRPDRPEGRLQPPPVQDRRGGPAAQRGRLRRHRHRHPERQRQGHGRARPCRSPSGSSAARATTTSRSCRATRSSRTRPSRPSSAATPTTRATRAYAFGLTDPANAANAGPSPGRSATTG